MKRYLPTGEARMRQELRGGSLRQKAVWIAWVRGQSVVSMP
jgi:hypothetical protein